MKRTPAPTETSGLFKFMHLRYIALRALDPLEFTLHETVLLLGAEHDIRRPKALTVVLGLRASAVSNLTTKLVHLGLILRKNDETEYVYG